MSCDFNNLGFVASTSRRWSRTLENVEVKCAANFTGATVLGLPQGSTSESVELTVDRPVPTGTPTTLLPWGIPVKGNHSDANFDLPTGIFTAPSNGIYHISGAVSWKENPTRNFLKRIVRVRVTDVSTTVTSTIQEIITQPVPNANINTVQYFIVSAELNTGDALLIEVEQDSGATVSVEGNEQGTLLNIWQIR